MSNSTGYHTDMSKERVALAVIGTLIYIGGFVGNLLSLIIFVPIKIRRVSTGLLFLLLTLSNNMQLLTLFIEFLEFTYEVSLFRTMIIRCRLIYWLQNIFRALSSFIACTISVDRMCRALYPSRAKRFCTCRTVVRLVVTYAILFSSVFVFYLFPYMREDAYGVCSSKSNAAFHLFVTSIWPPVRSVLVCLLPASIMITANIRLWREIRASKRRVGPQPSHVRHSASTEHMLIFLTIGNVLVFILTQVPFHLYSIAVRSIRSIESWRTPILLWSSLYFGIGFYIYCLTSPYFRSKFVSIIRGCLQRDDRTMIRRNTISQRLANPLTAHGNSPS